MTDSPYFTTDLEARYKDFSVVGKGGMGVVYRARDKVFDRPTAVKILDARFAREDFVRRLFEEAKIIANLASNPHIATLYDIGKSEEGMPYLAMEFLEGTPLDKYLIESLSRSSVLSIGLQVAVALLGVHEKHVAHRDLKPSNIFLQQTHPSFPLLAKVVDFGIGSAYVPEQSDRQETAIIGTPRYIAPEIVAGNTPTPASDVYSLGIILYEMATGKYPYDAHDTMQYIAAHIVQEPKMDEKKDLTLDFPKKFYNIIKDSLAKDPQNRPPIKEVISVLSSVFVRTKLFNDMLQHKKELKEILGHPRFRDIRGVGG